ncbi:hypothetical protein [Sphingorhabdus sp.]|uniref:hypothetical protein n=1 Tax=Sphingorhabdus sp. TaxID=1902408 RepID=UPI0032B807AD
MLTIKEVGDEFVQFAAFLQTSQKLASRFCPLIEQHHRNKIDRCAIPFRIGNVVANLPSRHRVDAWKRITKIERVRPRKFEEFLILFTTLPDRKLLKGIHHAGNQRVCLRGSIVSGVKIEFQNSG